MSGHLKLILLCIMCTAVTSTYFNWSWFNAIEGDEETEFDYSNLTLKSFEDINYVLGNFTFKVGFNQSDPSYNQYMIRYYMAHDRIGRGRITETLTAANLYVCTFFDWIFAWNLLPMTHNHNDFESNGESNCPIEAKTYNIYEVNNITQLNASSYIPEGDNTIRVVFCKDGKNVGGFEGHFYSSNEEIK